VATTLQQIISGVRAAQAAVTATGARVNPQVEAPAMRVVGGKKEPLVDWESGTLLQAISFDVAVTVSETEKSGAGLRVGIPVVSASLEGGSGKQESAVNRIRFTVPIVLPKHPYPPRE